MRHFDFLGTDESPRLFLHPPCEFGLADGAQELGVALGATLYIPAVRPRLAHDVVRQRRAGAQSVVICLEDAVSDADLRLAERNVAAAIEDLHDCRDELPLIFVRVRAAEQITHLIAGSAGRLDALAGFVLPKFDDAGGEELLASVEAARVATGRRLLAMPVIEGRAVAHLETRAESLLEARRIVDKHIDLVPAIRIGGTDLSAVWGLPRPRELTVWDLRMVADALGDIVNVFGRAEGGYPVSGAVWEYFPTTADRRGHEATSDALLREVALDLANGLTGKTVIHPAHVPIVNALSVVTAEDHADAADILARSGGGATASTFGNKMNESRPHTAWAVRVMQRARAFGVARPEVSTAELIAACRHR